MPKTWARSHVPTFLSCLKSHAKDSSIPNSLRGMLIRRMNTRGQQLQAISARPTLAPRFPGFTSQGQKAGEMAANELRPKFVTGARFQMK